MQTVEIEAVVPREAGGIKCQACGIGYAERVDTTADERKKYGCGRSWECCDRAFVCSACGARLVGRAEAPEIRW